MVVDLFMNSSAPYRQSIPHHPTHLDVAADVLESDQLLRPALGLDERISLRIRHDAGVARRPTRAMDQSRDVGCDLWLAGGHAQVS